MSKRFNKIVDLINSLTKSKVLDYEDELFLKKALKDLGHAISVKNSRKIEETVDRICQVLLEKMR